MKYILTQRSLHWAPNTQYILAFDYNIKTVFKYLPNNLII